MMVRHSKRHSSPVANQALPTDEVSHRPQALARNLGHTVRAERSSTGQSIFAEEEILGEMVTATMCTFKVRS